MNHQNVRPAKNSADLAFENVMRMAASQLSPAETRASRPASQPSSSAETTRPSRSRADTDREFARVMAASQSFLGAESYSVQYIPRAAPAPERRILEVHVRVDEESSAPVRSAVPTMLFDRPVPMEGRAHVLSQSGRRVPVVVSGFGRVQESSELSRRIPKTSESGRVGVSSEFSKRVVKKEKDDDIVEMFAGVPGSAVKKPRPSAKAGSSIVFNQFSQASFQQIYAYMQQVGNELVEENNVFKMLTTVSNEFARNFDKMLGNEQIDLTLFGYTISDEDLKGMQANEWLTSSVIFAICMLMSQKYAGNVIPPGKAYETHCLHLIADTVGVVSPDCFAFANGREDSKNYDRQLNNVVGQIISQLTENGLSPPFTVLIPFSTHLLHWYVMGVHITKEMVSMITFNSCAGIEDKAFSLELLNTFTIHTAMLFGGQAENSQNLIYDKFPQQDGHSCGVFSLFFIAMIQNKPDLIDEILAEHASLAPSKLKAVGIRRSARINPHPPIDFDPNLARNAIQCMIFYMLGQRMEVESEFRKTFRNGREEFNPETTHLRRVEGIKQYMKTSDPAILDNVLDEFETSPTTNSEFKQYGQAVSPIASAVLTHYKDAGAPHMVQLYAGCVSTLKPAGTSDRIFTFAEALDMDCEEHDRNHFWVQNFFPTTDRSGANKATLIVDKSVAVFFSKSPVLMERLRLAVMCLIFNKIGLCFNPRLSRAPLIIFDRALFERVILQNTHYRLRVTRWLYFLRLFEMGHMANSFYALLRNEMANNTFTDLSAMTKTEWSKAVNRPLWE